MSQDIIEKVLKEKNQWFSIEELSGITGIKEDEVAEFCRRLRKNKRAWHKIPRLNRRRNRQYLVYKHIDFKPKKESRWDYDRI